MQCYWAAVNEMNCTLLFKKYIKNLVWHLMLEPLFCFLWPLGRHDLFGAAGEISKTCKNLGRRPINVLNESARQKINMVAIMAYGNIPVWTKSQSKVSFKWNYKRVRYWFQHSPQTRHALNASLVMNLKSARKLILKQWWLERQNNGLCMCWNTNPRKTRILPASQKLVQRQKRWSQQQRA